MKAFKWLPAVAAVSLALTGCGSDSKSGGVTPTPPPSTTYTWQMIDLYKTERNKVTSGCAIFADVEGTSTGEVIASRVADRGYKILYHAADGTVLSQHTIDGSKIPASGKITIDKNLLPNDGGYVSVEEQNTLNPAGSRDTYMLSIGKDLLTDMTLVVRTEQASSNSCYRGEQDLPYETNGNAVVTVFPGSGSAPSSFHQTSSVDKRENGKVLATDIPVVANVPSPNSILVTAFGSYTSNEAKNLDFYAIVPKAKVYDSTTPPTDLPTTQLKSDGLVRPGFSSTDLTVDSESSVDVVLSGDIYKWQPIYESSSNFSLADGVSDFSSWAMNLKGITQNDGWLYAASIPVSNNSIDIVLPNTSDFGSSSVDQCGASGFCANVTGFTATDFVVQRTHLRSKNANGNLFYQTIFNSASNAQVLMTSSTERLVPEVTDRLEIGLAKATKISSDSLFQFMEQTFDVQEVIKNQTVDYQDRNGYVSLPTARKNRDIGLRDGQYEYFSNKKN